MAFILLAHRLRGLVGRRSRKPLGRGEENRGLEQGRWAEALLGSAIVGRSSCSERAPGRRSSWECQPAVTCWGQNGSPGTGSGTANCAEPRRRRCRGWHRWRRTPHCPRGIPHRSLLPLVEYCDSSRGRGHLSVRYICAVQRAVLDGERGHYVCGGHDLEFERYSNHECVDLKGLVWDGMDQRQRGQSPRWKQCISRIEGFLRFLSPGTAWACLMSSIIVSRPTSWMWDERDKEPTTPRTLTLRCSLRACEASISDISHACHRSVGKSVDIAFSAQPRGYKWVPCMYYCNRQLSADLNWTDRQTNDEGVIDWKGHV